MSDLRKKPNPENIPKIEAYIRSLTAEINEIKGLAEIQDSVSWEKVKKIIDRKAAALDFDLDNFSVLSDKDIYSCLQARKDLKYFVALIEGGQKALDDLNQKLEEAKEKLRELKSRVG